MTETQGPIPRQRAEPPFAAVEAGIECRFTPEERGFLAEIVPMLEGLGPVGEGPAAGRLTVPVYLDDAMIVSAATSAGPSTTWVGCWAS